MKKLVISLCLLVMAMQMAFADDQRVIGVTAFKNLVGNKNFNWLEIGIAESVTIKLKKVKEYVVVDRINIDKIMKEIMLSQTGLTEVKNANKIGKALNADLLVVGTFQAFGKDIRITAKIVDVNSHKVLKDVEATGKIDNIFSLQDIIALKIINESNIEMTSSLKKEITNNYTRNISAYEFFSKGQRLYYRAKYDEAISYFNKAVNIDSTYSLAYAGLAKAHASLYWQIKNFQNKINPSLLEKSYTYSKKALAISPDLDEAHLSLAKYYQNVESSKVPDKWKLCEASTKKTLGINPNNGDAYLLMSRIYGYDDVKEENYLKTAISKNKFLADAQNNLGVIYLNRKQYDLAMKSFQATVDIDPDYKIAYMNMGVIYSEKGDKNKAIEMYKKIIEKHPDYTLGLVNIGIAYRDLKQYDTALGYFFKAIKAKPDYAFGLGEIGYIYLKKKQYHNAINYYKQAIRYSKNDKFSLANLGVCYENTGDYTNAIYYLKQVLYYHPKYAWAAGELGWIYRFKLNNKNEALTWYNKALSLDPMNSGYQKQVNELSSSSYSYSGSDNSSSKNDNTADGWGWNESKNKKDSTKGFDSWGGNDSTDKSNDNDAWGGSNKKDSGGGWN